VTVLLTGSQGRIGRSLARSLPELGWQLRHFDRLPADPPADGTGSAGPTGPADSAGAEVADQLVGELTDPDALDRAMAGVEAVIHLAGQPTEAPWPVIRESNIEGTFQLFEAARRAGVRRVVYASSNHAVGFTSRPAGSEQLAADTPARPDTLYGVSKVFGETLGRYYSDRYGFRVACLRIGTFAERPPDPRSQASWLAPADCARLVDACLRSASLDYALIWGVSANRERWWSLAAGERLGYRPQEDASRYRSPDPQPGVPLDLVGGMFTEASFGIDEIAGAAARETR
jgi:uronate dehydrogenase